MTNCVKKLDDREKLESTYKRLVELIKRDLERDPAAQELPENEKVRQKIIEGTELWNFFQIFRKFPVEILEKFRVPQFSCIISESILQLYQGQQKRGKTSKEIFHESAGWRHLETSMNALKRLFELNKQKNLLKRSLFDLLQGTILRNSTVWFMGPPICSDFVKLSQKSAAHIPIDLFAKTHFIYAQQFWMKHWIRHQNWSMILQSLFIKDYPIIGVK